MDLAVSTCYDYRVPIEQSIELIGRSGFQLISLGGREAHSHYQKDQGRAKLAEIAPRWGLSIDSIHAPFGSTADITQSEAVLRHSAVVEMKRTIAACNELEVRTAVLHLNSHRTDSISDRLQNQKKSIPEILDCAHDNNIRVAIENLPDDNSLILLKFVLDTFEDSLLGLCFDSGHAALHKDSLELLDKYRSRLFAIHLHDNDGKTDLHQLPFEGTTDLPNFAAQLNKGDLTCPITVESEVQHSSYKTADAFLKQAFEGGNKFMEMLKMR
jgi:sugar phosphate isomerase/epimerase